jgi:hypothetical protein
MGKDSSAVAEERKVWVTDFVAKGCASRFATEWSFVWCKYSEIKSGDKTLDAELDRWSKDFTSRGGITQRRLGLVCVFALHKEHARATSRH